MKHPFFSYRTAFILTGITLVFVIAAIAGTRFTTWSSDPSGVALFTDLKSAVAPEALAGWDYGNADWAQDYYTTWPNSTTLRSDDVLARTLYALGSSGTKSTIMDINGDGLQDILIHAYQTYWYGAVFLNTGGLKFSLAYKCWYNSGNLKYCGDCAAI